MGHGVNIAPNATGGEGILIAPEGSGAGGQGVSALRLILERAAHRLGRGIPLVP